MNTYSRTMPVQSSMLYDKLGMNMPIFTNLIDKNKSRSEYEYIIKPNPNANKAINYKSVLHEAVEARSKSQAVLRGEVKVFEAVTYIWDNLDFNSSNH